jgi:DNA-binding NarL/FixJ family response regulator
MGAGAPFAARAFPARAVDDADAVMVVHVIPIRAAAHEPLLRRAILALAPARPAPPPPVELVQSLLDLTPTEARVACALAAGKTVEEIAAESRNAQATIRTHLHRILEKTGCTRQAEIVALLAGISSTRLIAPCAE